MSQYISLEYIITNVAKGFDLYINMKLFEVFRLIQLGNLYNLKVKVKYMIFSQIDTEKMLFVKDLIDY